MLAGVGSWSWRAVWVVLAGVWAAGLVGVWLVILACVSQAWVGRACAASLSAAVPLKPSTEAKSNSTGSAAIW